MNRFSLCTMDDLTNNEIFEILASAKDFSSLDKDWQFPIGGRVANLFFEPSTRTHYSFQSAQMQLGLQIANMSDATNSSIVKGESIYDTVKTFECIGYDALVIRSKQDNYFEELKGIDIPIINAGDGCGNHPSQCLLDLYTIYDEFNRFEDLNVVIVGDIKHSRVAGSNIATLKRLGANVKVSGPDFWMSTSDDYLVMDEAVAWADVVMLLRIQHERHADTLTMSEREYLETYGLTKKRYEMMKESAIIMHPAPVNRGVEIDSELVESAKSRIFTQMRNGVLVRKAIMARAFNEYPRGGQNNEESN